MSQAVSPSAQKPYGLVRVVRLWQMARSSVYARRERRANPASDRRGPKPALDDEALEQKIREALYQSPWVGEGYRKVWARLKAAGIRTSPRRVLRLMRETDLLAPTRMGHAHGPKAHDGTIIPDRPDVRGSTDGTSTLTDKGSATIFFVVDHHTAECLGIHAARRGTRFEALDPLRQAIREVYGRFDAGVAKGLELRHDHGSQFISGVYQDELRFLGITGSRRTCASPKATAVRSGSFAR